MQIQANSRYYQRMNKQKNDVAMSIAGVILAAGSASRIGQPKLLLPWKGEALIRHAARTAVSCLNPVVVVTGAWEKEIRDALKDLPVKMVHNAEWAEGQSTSVRAGINSLPKETAAAIFCWVTNPMFQQNLSRV